jgi:ABC-type dipeptide/oligopeptide/nickel transport system permease subunit/sugar lactone lactonase YvrE
MTLVLAVATVRLAVGISVGLASGWSAGWPGRLLDLAISAALAAPVLFVALCLIAAVGIRLGLWAFILGLSVTGWAETARLIREQTRTIKSQRFIEAARALGASGPEIALRHVLPHIMPIMWMLLAFEISSTLLVTAGLGFLGYFSNAVWIPLGDWSGLRAPGRPELGQMLASGAQIAQQAPWGMLAAGSLICLTVLGFNLLGEGLRLQLSSGRRPTTRWAIMLDQMGVWVEDRMFDQVAEWRRMGATLAAVVGLLLLGLGSGWLLLQSSRAAARADPVVAVPGDHLWAADHHDAQGTLYVPLRGPRDPALEWVFAGDSGFAGSPVVAADGTIYASTDQGTLYALGPEGDKRWEAKLPAPSAGAPALGGNGDVYVADHSGNLTAVRADGQRRWTADIGGGHSAIAGPIADADGNIYYVTELNLFSVTLDGIVRWHAPIPKYSYLSPLPRLSADGLYLFFEDIVVDTATGVTWFGETTELMDKYFVGTDGDIYLRSQAGVMTWRPTEAGAQLEELAQWDARGLGLQFRFPADAGLTPDGRIWVLFASQFEFAKLLWLDQGGEVAASLDYPYRMARMIGVDQDGATYMCGLQASASAALACQANRPSPGEPLWEVEFERGALPVGGALVAARLYLTTSDGLLFAIGDGSLAR